MKVLVCRNDKLGDFMLAWPALAMLKSSLDQSDEVFALVSPMNEESAQNCPWLDGVIVDDPVQSKTISHIKAQRFNSVIALFSNWHVALLLKKSGIKERIAPATKLAQILYTDKLVQRRSKSLKPEYEYNCDLVKYFLKKHGLAIKAVSPPFWPIPSAPRKNEKTIFFHPGHGGSSAKIHLRDYAKLFKLLSNDFEFKVLISYGPSENDLAQNALRILCDVSVNAEIMPLQQSMFDYANMIKQGDVFISCATGTLHVAANLNIPTIAFYPVKKSSTSLRWRTTNDPKNALYFDCDYGDDKDNEFLRIDIDDCYQKTRDFLKEIRFGDENIIDNNGH